MTRSQRVFLRAATTGKSAEHATVEAKGTVTVAAMRCFIHQPHSFLKAVCSGYQTWHATAQKGHPNGFSDFLLAGALGTRPFG